jgi:hypothetical protein
MTNEMQGTDVLLKAEEVLKGVEKPQRPEKPDRPAKAEIPKAEPAPASARTLPSIRPLPRETLAIFEIVAHAIAWLGVIIIAYGIVSTVTSEVWLPLERFILPIAATLVLIATLLNALASYVVTENPGPPSVASRYVTGPAVIVLCAAALVMVWYRGLPISVILGLAVLGLAWSLMRVLPRPAKSW